LKREIRWEKIKIRETLKKNTLVYKLINNKIRWYEHILIHWVEVFSYRKIHCSWDFFWKKLTHDNKIFECHKDTVHIIIMWESVNEAF
jgi:hypothetical protein